MNEEITNESATPVETPSEEAPTPSLDDIASEFSVEQEANNFQAQPAPQAPAPNQYQPQPGYDQQFSNIPDPNYDPDGWNQWMQQQTFQQNSVVQELSGIKNEIESYKQQMAQQKIEADLGKAVNHVNEKLNVDPKMAEVALEIEYRENPAFKRIWDHRDQNPAAFQKALDVVANKWTGKFATRTNDQLVENVRAAKTSQQTMANAPKEDPYGDVANMSPSEFDRWWSQQKG